MQVHASNFPASVAEALAQEAPVYFQGRVYLVLSEGHHASMSGYGQTWGPRLRDMGLDPLSGERVADDFEGMDCLLEVQSPYASLWAFDPAED